jgi:two-component system nitrate/nitrite response regulator NarL
MIKTQPNFAILEDHPLVLAGIQQQLADDFADAHLIYAGSNVSDAITKHSVRQIDCAIVDLDLGDGQLPVNVISQLVSAEIPCLVVSVLAKPAIVQSVMSAGALGFVSKNSPTYVLTRAIKAVLAGETFTSPELAGALASPNSQLVKLSEREKSALTLYASGLTLDQVAEKMNVAASTVKEYLDRVRDKYTAVGIYARTKTQLYQQAREEGLLL